MKVRIKNFLVYAPSGSTVIVTNRRNEIVIRGLVQKLICDKQLKILLCPAMSTRGRVIDTMPTILDKDACIKSFEDDWAAPQSYRIKMSLADIGIEDLGRGIVRIRSCSQGQTVFCYPKFD